MSLHVPSFGGGIVRVGSPDTQATDELLEADSLDIGPRGQLICTTDVSNYVAVQYTGGATANLLDVYGVADVALGSGPRLLVGGRGRNLANTADAYILANCARAGAASPVTGAPLVTSVPIAAGALLTVVQFPGVFTIDTVTGSLVLLCFGAREGTYPRAVNCSLRALLYDVAGGTVNVFLVGEVDALGTGFYSAAFAGGSKAKALFFRGIVGYNNHVFGWGFDNTDATNGDGPARVMFSNLGDPRKWGNDNVATTGDRDYTDSDAIVLGDAGEIVRGALVWNGRLYFGTNQQLHYIAGYGRDSFLTDGANPVAKSYNIVGPRAMIEGPDKLLYQVSDQGLVSFDGAQFEPLFKKLVSFDGRSTGYWDLIWTDATAAVGFPGRTNQDLVWMAVDWDREQVLVGIPFCNATAGYGVGVDTVVIKYHPRTGGFTRQVFVGVAFSAAGYFRREGQQREVRVLATATAGQSTIQTYGAQASPATSPVLSARLPSVEFGPYAPFGPDGQGALRRAYLTVAWEASTALPIVFAITTTIDGAANDAFTLTVAAAAPGAPVAGDCWLDTSETDTNLGNATAGALIPAAGGFLMKSWSGSAWRLVPGAGGRGTRATMALPLTRRVGDRVSLRARCTAAAGRFQIEGLGLNPGGGTNAA